MTPIDPLEFYKLTHVPPSCCSTTIYPRISGRALLQDPKLWEGCAVSLADGNADKAKPFAVIRNGELAKP